jgi:ketosteroid isomerase-like protein
MRVLPVGVIFLFFMACGTKPEDSGKLGSEVMEVDRDFNKRAQEKGIAEAFIYYADEKVIKPTAGQQPIVGKFALLEFYKNNPPAYHLTWEPLRAEASGSLGYTFGGYTLVTKTPHGNDTTLYGNYISIWKRKNDGTWRYVFDTGSPTPEPVVLKEARDN